MAEPFLPQVAHRVTEADIEAVTRVLRGAWLTTGPAVAAFEAALATRVDAPHAVACASGTAALHLACLALGLGPGDRAIVPSITFLATANCVRHVGADVVFADVDPDSGLMTAATLEAAVARAGGAVAAVFPVHLNGQCADMPALADCARRHDARIVEDASHALGAVADDDKGRAARVGTCARSDLATFSFHAVKTIAMGEGGAVTTRDAQLAERIARLRNHGMSRAPAAFEDASSAFDAEGAPNPWYYEMAEPGLNYRASDIHCALGLSQLARLDDIAADRARLVARYDALIAPLAPAMRPVARTPDCRPVWHLYPVLIDFAALGMTRAALMRALSARGIGSQVHYIPVHRQPYYRARYGTADLPGAEAYYARCLSLPLFSGMTPADVTRVIETLTEILDSNAR